MNPILMFVVKSIASATIGSSFYAWFKTTKCGLRIEKITATVLNWVINKEGGNAGTDIPMGERETEASKDADRT